jgi:hypothetical protein
MCKWVVWVRKAFYLLQKNAIIQRKRRDDTGLTLSESQGWLFNQLVFWSSLFTGNYAGANQEPGGSWGFLAVVSIGKTLQWVWGKGTSSTWVLMLYRSRQVSQTHMSTETVHMNLIELAPGRAWGPQTTKETWLLTSSSSSWIQTLTAVYVKYKILFILNFHICMKNRCTYTDPCISVVLHCRFN